MGARKRTKEEEKRKKEGRKEEGEKGRKNGKKEERKYKNEMKKSEGVGERGYSYVSFLAMVMRCRHIVVDKAFVSGQLQRHQ